MSNSSEYTNEINNKNEFVLSENTIKVHLLNNDKKQDRAGYKCYENHSSGDKISIMWVIDGHGLHYQYHCIKIDTGGFVADFLDSEMKKMSPEKALIYYKNHKEGLNLFKSLQKELLNYMEDKMSKYGIKLVNRKTYIWEKRGLNLCVHGGATINLAFIYQNTKIKNNPKARIYTIGDSLIGYGNCAIDPNLNGLNLSPEIVKELKNKKIEILYDIPPSCSRLGDSPVYDNNGERYPLPITFDITGIQKPAYFVSNCRQDVAIRYIYRDKFNSTYDYKMATFSNMGNFGLPIETNSPQYSEIFQITEPLSLFTDGIGDCIYGNKLEGTELDENSISKIKLSYEEDNILNGITPVPFKFTKRNLNKDFCDNWDDDDYIQKYKEVAHDLFGSIIDDMAIVIFKP